MSKQIAVKSINATGPVLKKMFEEAQKYLENIGFIRTPLMSITDKDHTFRSFLFSQAFEKVVMEYKKTSNEEILRLIFNPLEIKFIYDILLMRFNQLAQDQEDKVFIYNE